MDEIELYTLIHKYFSGEATTQEKELLKEQINVSPKFRQIFLDWQKLWQAIPKEKSVIHFNVEQGWQNLETVLNLKSATAASRHLPFSQKPSQASSYPQPSLLFLKYSTAAVLFLAMGIFLYYWLYSASPDQWQTYTTQNGERVELKFPDGSQVYLNAGSKISKNFSASRREVWLEGEGFFTASTDQRPFIVHTKNSQVRVLGTEFNIWARNEKTRLVVKKGKVSFSALLPSASQPVFLKKNQMSVCHASLPPETPSEVNADEYLGWLKKKLVFHKQPLEEVAAEIQRIYDIKIRINRPALKSRSISGAFDETLDVDSIVTIIANSVGLAKPLKRNGVYYLE